MQTHLSIWQKTTEIPAREPLSGDLQADVAIIGAGMAGVLTAWQLRRQGVRAVVLEADRIAGGQTGRTTAKITSQHGMIYDALIKKMGAQAARQYARANEQAIREYVRIIESEKIDCDYRETSAYLYSTTAAEPMRREAEAAASLGIDAHFTTETELPLRLQGAVRFDRQAQFHPLSFLRALCRDLEIYEDTPVLSVDGNRITTSRGTVEARHIVFACHFPFGILPGFYFMRMHQERSYVLALESDWLPQGMYLGVDNDGLSFRTADHLLLLGGGGHRTGENSTSGRYDQLRSRASKILPQSREVTRWSAQDCITLDGVPYIGQYSASEPNWYVATGFAKWGMTSSMVAALLISGQICGATPDWAGVFSPSRFTPSASAKSLMTEAVQSFKGLSRGAFSLPTSTLDALPPGHGGLIDADGQKAGVYKDESGQCHLVDPRCPHLGCQLEWNPDELSWDCPCHGSRFHYDGSLIDNPAQTPLKTPGNHPPENQPS